MRLPDTMSRKKRLANDTTIFAWSQLQGFRPPQDNVFVHHLDECFVLAEGVEEFPHADTAARLAADTALWGYKHVRLRPFYWADKRLLLKRIFRSSNLSVWQKRREKGFENGLAAHVCVAIVGAQKMWVAGVGDNFLFLYRDGLIDVVLPGNGTDRKRTQDSIGTKRLGIVPQVKVEKILPNDVVCMASPTLVSFVSEEEFRVAFELAGETEQSVTQSVTNLLQTAKDHGCEDNITACIIKRLDTQGVKQ